MTLELLEQLVIAAKEGKTLQSWPGLGASWEDVSPDEFAHKLTACRSAGWRVKPELKEWWVNQYGGGSETKHESREEADEHARIPYLAPRKRLTHIKELEVIEFR